MALRALKPCSKPGCSELTRERYCEKHRQEEARRYDQQRGTAAQRGYDARWRRYRAWYLKRNPLCVECEKKGIIRVATDVDHKQPVTGPNDPMFYVEGNHQALCHACHSAKTMRECVRGAGTGG